MHSSYAPNIGAFAIEGAFVTRWTLRVAYLPPVPDKVDMQRVDPGRRHLFCEDVVRLVGVYFRSDQAQALADAVDVGINGHLWLSFFQMSGGTACRCCIACCQASPSSELQWDREQG